MGPPSLPVAFPALHGEKAGVGTILAAREYKRLGQIRDIGPFLHQYSPPSGEKIKKYFGNALAPAIIRENENDCLGSVDIGRLEKVWPEIRQILSENPAPDELYRLLEKLDAKRSVEDIGVSQADTEQLLDYSPWVRNRLTLMRMRRLLSR